MFCSQNKADKVCNLPATSKGLQLSLAVPLIIIMDGYISNGYINNF